MNMGFVFLLVYKMFVHVSVHLFALSGMACAKGIFAVNCLTGNRYKWRYKWRTRYGPLSRHYRAYNLTTMCHDCNVCYGLFLALGAGSIRMLHVPHATCRLYIWQLLVDSPKAVHAGLQGTYRGKTSDSWCFLICGDEIFA
jgi:hypothetical protein